LEPDAESLIKSMLSAAQRAIDLDPMDADAQEAVGYAQALLGDVKQAGLHFDKALKLNPNSFDILNIYACWAHVFGNSRAGAEAVDRAIRLNPLYPPWAVACFRVGLLMDGRYEDVVRTASHQPEENWNSDGYVIMAGSIAALGRIDEAEVLVARGAAKFPGLLSIEKFALNRGWAGERSRNI
jgi:tetratricopeptide (TPR) repeat protein